MSEVKNGWRVRAIYADQFNHQWEIISIGDKIFYASKNPIDPPESFNMLGDSLDNRIKLMKKVDGYIK